MAKKLNNYNNDDYLIIESWTGLGKPLNLTSKIIKNKQYNNPNNDYLTSSIMVPKCRLAGLKCG